MSRACLGPRPSSFLFRFICLFPILISFCTIFCFEGERWISLDRNPVGSSVVRLRFAVLTFASTLFFLTISSFILRWDHLHSFLGYCFLLSSFRKISLSDNPAPTRTRPLYVPLLPLYPPSFIFTHVARQRPVRISTELKIEVDISPFESWSRVEGKSKEVRISRFPSSHPFFFSSDFSRGT